MRRIISIALLAYFLTVGASSAYPCSCSSPSKRKAYRQAHAVFIGQVLGVDVNPALPSALQGVVFFGVRFKVEKAWKGVKGQDITILSDQGWRSCIGLVGLYKYRQGERYLVYAYGKELTDEGCSRSVSLGDASEDVKKLNNLWFRFFARLLPF